MKFQVILPVHNLTDDSKKLLKRAIDTIDSTKAELIIVHSPLVKPKDISVNKKLKHKFILNTGKTDFCSQVNLGIENVDAEWFSILELDDMYTPTWLSNVERYSSVFPDVDVFLPIVADIDEKEKFLSFTNEALWATGFSNIQGYLDNELLLEYQNFQTSGAVYKTEKILKFGKLKTNIKLLFGYEYLLRLTHNNIKIMTIPKIGYKHTTMRTNSLFWQYKNDDSMRLSPEESKFWLETAKKEYFFADEREIIQK